MLEINKIYNMDCLEGMKLLPSNSIDAIVTDPPYWLSFMGKKWDYDVPSKEIREEALRVLKPWWYLLAFAGTRTQHRMACRIEDAWFEIRDMIAWVYGSWFPKSHNIWKSVNKLETEEWLNIWKALDIVNEKDIISVWKNYSNNVSIVETQYQKNQTETGMSIQIKDTVPDNAMVNDNQEIWDLIVNFAIKNFIEAQAIDTKINTVLQSVEAEIRQRQDLAKFVEQSLQNQSLKFLNTSIVEWSVNELQKEKTSEIIKVEEALMILHGNKKYWEDEVIDVLCVALTENLKLIILNQSKTFQNLDTKLQMECVSAINVTITEYTAECLISNTVGIAKKIAVDKLLSNEREVIKTKEQTGAKFKTVQEQMDNGGFNDPNRESYSITKGTSEREWRWSWLKPALEPITMARKPLEKWLTIAENVLKYGTGGINIDESRVGTEGGGTNCDNRDTDGNCLGHNNAGKSTSGQTVHAKQTGEVIGRFPANLIHDNSEEVRDCFPDSKGGAFPKTHGSSGFVSPEEKESRLEMNDSGNASRFFKSIIYKAKASKSERNKGCEEMEDKDRVDYGGFHSDKGLIENNRNPENRLPNKNNHPTVKPIALMEYLVKLVSKEWAVVIDPFAWSGSTMIACKRLWRQYIGFELDQWYCEIAENRVASY